MGAVKLGGELKVCFQRARQGLFQQDSLPPRDQLGGVLAVAVGRGRNHRRVRNPCLGKFFDRAKNGNVAARLGGESLGLLRLLVTKRGEGAISRLSGQFMNVKGMDTSHSAHARNSNSDRFAHGATHPRLTY